MITLDIIVNHLIQIFKGFKAYVIENNFECDIINTHNHPHFSKITTASPNKYTLESQSQP